MSLAAGRPRPLLNAYSLDGGYWSRRLPTFKDGQMRFLSPQLHQVLDYVTIAAFALSPTLVPLSGVAAIVAYALAVVHLAVTVSTDFPGGSRRPLPLPAHGALEAVVSVAVSRRVDRPLSNLLSSPWCRDPSGLAGQQVSD